MKPIGAKSPRNLRRHSARVLIIDEAAAMEADAGEGDVISRAIARTTGFADRKIIEGSTLTDDTSNVLRTYANSNRARFEVPCPECGGFTFMEWKHIGWEEGRPETVAFRCPHCARRWSPRSTSTRWSRRRAGTPGALRCGGTTASTSRAGLAAEERALGRARRRIPRGEGQP